MMVDQRSEPAYRDAAAINEQLFGTSRSTREPSPNEFSGSSHSGSNHISSNETHPNGNGQNVTEAFTPGFSGIFAEVTGGTFGRLE